MEEKRLGGRKFALSLKAGKPQNVIFTCEKADSQIVIRGSVNGVRFEQFRENGVKMASLPMVPASWPYTRPRRFRRDVCLREGRGEVVRDPLRIRE